MEEKKLHLKRILDVLGIKYLIEEYDYDDMVNFSLYKNDKEYFFVYRHTDKQIFYILYDEDKEEHFFIDLEGWFIQFAKEL